MIIEVGDQLAAFAEADLTDWSGMFFAVSPEKAAGTEVVTRLSPRLDGQGLVVSRAPRGSRANSSSGRMSSIGI